jgi:hypothetical protein
MSRAHPSLALGATLLVALPLLSPRASADQLVGALELGARHELVNDLKLSLAAQARFDAGRVERWLPEAGLSYELLKALDIGAGYRLSYARNAQGDFESAHRVHLQAVLSFKLKPLHTRLQYRLRLQQRWERTLGEPTDYEPTLRNALELSYTHWKPLLVPFVSAEHYLALDSLADAPTRRWRAMLGVQHEFGLATWELYYRLDVPGDDDPTRHMLGSSLQFEL